MQRSNKDQGRSPMRIAFALRSACLAFRAVHLLHGKTTKLRARQLNKSVDNGVPQRERNRLLHRSIHGVSMYPTALKGGKSEQEWIFQSNQEKKGLKAVGVKMRRFVLFGSFPACHDCRFFFSPFCRGVLRWGVIGVHTGPVGLFP